MQASTARTEQRLPRQVLQRSAAINARLATEADAETKTDPVVNAIPATPPAEAAQTAEPSPTPTPAAPPADPRHNDPRYWEQRFRVTAGRLEARESEHRTAVAGLRQQISEMQEQIRSLQVATPSSVPDLSQFLTPEQIEELGEEPAKAIVAAVMKGAQTEVRKALEAEIKPLKEQRASEQQQASEDRKTQFLHRLAELVPDYAQIDDSQEWLDWLLQDDEDGIRRQDKMTRLVTVGNAQKVARMFQQYIAESAPPAPPAPPVAPHGTGAGQHAAAPPMSGPLTAPTKAEIKDYYKRSALRKVTDRERVQFEARLKLVAGQ